jgi:colicin import membrane protein
LSSEYEYNVSKLLAEKAKRLQDLQNSDKSSNNEKDFLRMEIETLESLYENRRRGFSGS